MVSPQLRGGHRPRTVVFALTIREPKKKQASSSAATLDKSIADREQASLGKQAGLEMGTRVIARTGFPAGLNRVELARACVAGGGCAQSSR